MRRPSAVRGGLIWRQSGSCATAPRRPNPAGSTVPLCKSKRRRHSAAQQSDSKGTEMAFSLIDDTAGAIPMVVLTKDRLPAWLAEASGRGRNRPPGKGVGAEGGERGLGAG